MNAGDRWFVTGAIDDLKRGDIIEFKYPKDETKHFMQRIVGLPGERIEIREGKTFINGQPLVEDYLDPAFNKALPSFPEKAIPENKFFVMGDNRDNSSDSRYWGPVDRSLIEGKFYMRYMAGDEK
jgi:signal peptidase I